MMQVSIKFSIDGVTSFKSLSKGDKAELENFIIEALQTWGGQRDPDDWLFGSLENVKVKGLET